MVNLVSLSLDMSSKFLLHFAQVSVLSMYAHAQVAQCTLTNVHSCYLKAVISHPKLR